MITQKEVYVYIYIYIWWILDGWFLIWLVLLSVSWKQTKRLVNLWLWVTNLCVVDVKTKRMVVNRWFEKRSRGILKAVSGWYTSYVARWRKERRGPRGWRYVSVFPHWRYIRCKIGRVTTCAQCAITDTPCKVRLNVSPCPWTAL